ncbi:MAG: alpha-amylase family glycosyl hydrolase, partial [Natronospirillum sp.]
MQQTLRTQWQEIYGSEHEASLEQLLTLLEQKRTLFAERPADHTPDWYRDAVVYSLYVDAYAGDFTGLTNKLDYLAELGVNTLWLLPILDSPMRDQGFDIRDFRAVRDDLGGNSAFTRFIAAAHQKGIRLLFDMAVNHSSDQHPWFESARASKDSPYRDFYIWSDDTSRYSDARLIFKGMVPSNWEFNEATGDYFFHRFYAFQPDLNYRNPALLIAMIENFLFWKEQGVDGLRMDAIPFIWKEEGTNCEDLPTTHTILKLIRSALDYCQPGTLLIAEANMAPKQVVSYFGKDDECQAAYHFPLMPMFYIALAESTYHPIQQALSADVTPAIPDKSRWMSFLRCHDEL